MEGTTIHDVETRSLQVNVDERGELTEIWREDWDFYAGEDSPAMSYFSVTYPGVIRAWHRHRRGQIDHFVVPHGRVKVAVYDDRPESPTEGELDTLVVGAGAMEAVRVPGDCWHGFKVVGDEPATLVNFPTNLYDYEEPDEQRLPHDTDRIPMDWEAPPHG
jgi:dTDP-4-dehydrorhamnose 3,5-epimerase